MTINQIPPSTAQMPVVDRQHQPDRPATDRPVEATTGAARQGAVKEESTAANPALGAGGQTEAARPAENDTALEEARLAALQEAMEAVSRHVDAGERKLEFKMAENSGRVIITVLDKETDEVIRQIPPEDVVKFAEQIKDGGSKALDGLLFNDRA
ncbi:Similar to flagellar protein FlaG [gamma proteobacterium HdN1]|nr:Similar to flagellar protein FlaG [gamma proteobacterium HdN1]